VDPRAELSRILEPARVLTRPIERIAYSSDASFYRLIPQAVAQPRSIGEIQALFRWSQTHGIPMTFRAAGTSLSGQAITDGVLVDVSKHWRGMEALDEGKRVRVEPGVIGGVVNQHLAPYRAKLGPDPASINACMMGGILANNSSGMCCGVARNAYHTLESLTIVLPSGLVLDTADPASSEALERSAPEIARGLMELKARIERAPALRDRIRAKYRIKNTTGYSLNAFLDFSTPLEILRHLMIGSEGTLGFIAEAVLRTVPDDPVKSTGLLFFPELHSACAAIAPLRDSSAATLELMDRASLRSVESDPAISALVRSLPPQAASLLVEYQCAAEDRMPEIEARAREVFASLPLLGEPPLTRVPAEQAALWKIRRGIFPSVGAVRRQGTSVIIEDVAFEVPKLAPAVMDLQRLFGEHGYDDGVVFGHAKDGNVHFVITQSFNDAASVDRYEAFMADVADLVVGRYDGSLKAEHGTGRNMAPFVEAEWGAEAYAIMKELKALIDPHGLLNPGVILNSDPRAHVKDLKTLPVVEAEVDRCIECGWCERVCPSRDLTLTPRQRIVVQRELARLRGENGPDAAIRALEEDYRYAVMDTCAADGMCATACPVAIDTGQLVKRLRGAQSSPTARRAAGFAARHLEGAERSARVALRLGHAAEAVVGSRGVEATLRVARRLFGPSLPEWIAPMPKAASGLLPRTESAGATAIYFPTCLTRILGPSGDEGSIPSVAETVLAVAARAGFPVHIPPDAPGHCCGMPFSSKGYGDASRDVVNRTIARMSEWSREGALPIVVDTSSCAYTLRTCRTDLTPENQRRYDRLRILDGIEFAHDHLLPQLEGLRRARSIALHPVCSAVKMDTVSKLAAVARAAADSVTVPIETGCCGFAGDRGFLFPELTASATRAEAAEIHTLAHDGYYSSSLTCELAMTRATGKRYRSFWYLLESGTSASKG
jgi:D-lactate dehydrogenase